MWLRLPELQQNSIEAKKLQTKKLAQDYKNIKEILFYQGLYHISIIISMIISWPNILKVTRYKS